MAANSTRFHGMTRLMLASRDGDLAAVRSLLNDGANVNATSIDPIHGARGGNRRTPLMFASEKGHIDVVNELLSHGADPNIKSVGTKLEYNVNRNTFNTMRSKYFNECSGCTALMFASKGNHLDVVKALLAHKADPAISDVHGMNALDLAIAAAHEKIIHVLAGETHVKPEKLLGYFEEKKAAAKAARYTDRKESGYTDLMIATMDGNLPLVRELIKSGVDLNEFSEYSGAPALLMACEHGELEIVRALIEGGADVTALDINGYTALMHASERGDLNILKLVLEAVSDTYELDLEVQDYVNKATPDEDERASGFTALMFADKKEIVRELIKSGADVNHATRGKFTPLMRACREINDEVVAELCEHGADVNAVDSNPGDETDGYTPLLYAASIPIVPKTNNMIKTLCKYGANVNAKDANGYTALMHSCIDSFGSWPNDHHIIAAELVRCGANPRLKADDGSTALDILHGHEGSEIYMVVEAALHPTPNVVRRRGRSLVTRRNRRNTRLSEENMLQRWEGHSKKRHTRSLNRR
jgi:ankyrin repeat protein